MIKTYHQESDACWWTKGKGGTLSGFADQEGHGAGHEDQGKVEGLLEDLWEALEELIALDEDQESQGLVEEVWELQKKEEVEDSPELRKMLSKKLTGLDMTGCWRGKESFRG